MVRDLRKLEPINDLDFIILIAEKTMRWRRIEAAGLTEFVDDGKGVFFVSGNEVVYGKPEPERKQYWFSPWNPLHIPNDWHQVLENLWLFGYSLDLAVIAQEDYPLFVCREDKSGVIFYSPDGFGKVICLMAKEIAEGKI